MTPKLSVVAGVGLALGLARVGWADTILVPEDYATIQAAIDAAADGDEVLVAAGTYFESIDYLDKEIAVRSEAGAMETVIDASETGGSVVRIVGSGDPFSPRLEGFTIRGGIGGPVPLGALTVGGGLLIDSATPVVITCAIVDNSANFGGGAYCGSSVPVFLNCLFTGNSSGFGGGLFADNSVPFLANATFTGNTAGQHGGAIYSTNVSLPLVVNSILWQNEPLEVEGSGFTIYYSDVRGGWDGPGEMNIDADPRFADELGRLSAGSPCIDAGDNDAMPFGEGEDLDGNDRFVDDLVTSDTGAGSAPIVDMGAFEFPADPCVGDVDGDGRVDIRDLVDMLAQWGPCPSSPRGGCTADFNRDEVVDVADLLILFASFASCPRPGACCLPAECVEVDEDDCVAMGGTYIGDDTTCAGGACTIGACCMGDGTCVDATEDECSSMEGTYLGDLTRCETSACTGACCTYLGECVDDVSEFECSDLKGDFQGIGTSCDSEPCGVGACCLPKGGECVDDVSGYECEVGFGGVYLGDGSVCEKGSCDK